jgi:putative transposase
MRRYIRADIPGATYFFTVTLQDRTARWLVDHIATLRWQLIKRSFTRRLAEGGFLDLAAASRRSADERSVWQRRYWEHQIRDEEDFARHVDYIHFNPVKHGCVLRAADWPYSSLHRFIREGRLPADWGLAATSRGEYGE